METLFLNIQQQIAGNMPELSLVDEYYGQLETGENTYPVTFPCVFISIPEIVWTNTSRLEQSGEFEIQVRLALDCYDDTHYSSGTQEKITERVLLSKRLNALLHGHIFGDNGNFGSLSRILTRSYTLPGNIKVYEHTYKCSGKDRSAQPLTKKSPVPLNMITRKKG